MQYAVCHYWSLRDRALNKPCRRFIFNSKEEAASDLIETVVVADRKKELRDLLANGVNVMPHIKEHLQPVVPIFDVKPVPELDSAATTLEELQQQVDFMELDALKAALKQIAEEWFWDQHEGRVHLNKELNSESLSVVSEVLLAHGIRVQG